MKFDEIVAAAVKNLRQKTGFDEWQYQDADNIPKICIEKTFPTPPINGNRVTMLLRLKENGVKFSLDEEGCKETFSTTKIRASFTQLYKICALAKEVFADPDVTCDLVSKAADNLNKYLPTNMRNWKGFPPEGQRKGYLQFQDYSPKAHGDVKKAFLEIGGDENWFYIHETSLGYNVGISNPFEIVRITTLPSLLDIQKRRISYFFQLKGTPLQQNFDKCPDFLTLGREQKL